MGPTAVIAIGAIRLLVRTPAVDGMGQGDVHARRASRCEDAALVFVKSPSHFRQSFGPVAARILAANTPGPTAPDMRRIPFTKVTRPLYPLDPI